MKPVVFNGKFYSGGLNGVHRVADRLICEVDVLLSEMPQQHRPHVSVIVPASARWRPTVSAISVVEEPRRCGQLWEQFILPWKAQGALLVNLCNLAPVLHPRKILMMHDVQFLLPDNSYPFRQRLGYRLMTPWMAHTSLEVLTVSNFSRQMLGAFGVSRPDRTRVLSNGVDHILASEPASRVVPEHGLTRRKFVVLFGSGKAYKNNRVVFDAFMDTRLAGIGLVVVGSDREELTRAGLEIPPNAVFVGRVDDDELRELYEAALCLVFPSTTEGFGLPPAEAMACGCPAVVAPSGAIPEVCRDAAAYADVDDPASWSEAIHRLDIDADYRSAKVVAGRTLMSRFTWRAAGEKLLCRIMALSGHRPALKDEPAVAPIREHRDGSAPEAMNS